MESKQTIVYSFPPVAKFEARYCQHKLFEATDDGYFAVRSWPTIERMLGQNSSHTYDDLVKASEAAVEAVKNEASIGGYKIITACMWLFTHDYETTVFEVLLALATPHASTFRAPPSSTKHKAD
jgi:hypothetical protein